MKKKAKLLLYTLALSISPLAVNAHIMGGNGLADGVLHPLLGLDHLLAMVAVGIIGTRYKDKAVWLIPSAFVISMVTGGFIWISGLHIPFAEAGIALSVIFLGLAIAMKRNVPFHLTIAFVAVSAIFHGHAHATEMPVLLSPLLYSIGFVISTSSLHITGILLGRVAAKTETSVKLLRYAGASMGILGIFFLF
ncbi:HupE/UreJ family protein [Candidatus Woesearchaeota archaeon]|nr:HupE/UreJ family protein [Candidatus Woesearchaeota archaeon]